MLSSVLPMHRHTLHYSGPKRITVQTKTTFDGPIQFFQSFLGQYDNTESNCVASKTNTCTLLSQTKLCTCRRGNKCVYMIQPAYDHRAQADPKWLAHVEETRSIETSSPPSRNVWCKLHDTGTPRSLKNLVRAHL